MTCLNLTPVDFSFPLPLLELQASFGKLGLWKFAIAIVPLEQSMVTVSGAPQLATFLPLQQPSDGTIHDLV